MSAHAAIYGARKRLGLDDETARDFYQRTVGKRRLTEMSSDEQRRVLTAMNAVSVPGVAARSARKVDGPYGPKLQALWISGWHLGVVRNRDDAALIEFVRRQADVDHTRFLRDPEQAQKAVEALKSWLAREGGVIWKGSPVDSVITAQVKLLDDIEWVKGAARAVLGRGVPRERKHELMRELGGLIRQRAAG